jgi:hypothetical protein
MGIENKNEPTTEFEKKLVQEKYNTNVAFYVHIKTFDNDVRSQIEEKIGDVFYFLKGIDWKFDSYGVENAGSRGNDVLCYFILRTADVQKLQKLFTNYLSEYDNVIKITCSVATYEKKEETYFELEV